MIFHDFLTPLAMDFGAECRVSSAECRVQGAQSLVQNAESLSAQNAESPWCTMQSAESLMPTPQCRFSDVECRMQSAAEIRVFPGPPPDSRLGRRGKKLGNCRILEFQNSSEIAISEIFGF